MKIVKILPGPLRRLIRERFDRCFCRKDLKLAKVGGVCTWVVLPHRLTKGVAVLSGGAGHDISFEIELAQKYGCEVAVFDPSPTGRDTFDKVENPPHGLKFHLLGLSGESKKVLFAAPANKVEGSYCIPERHNAVLEFECVSPRDAMCRAGFERIELLKIDIEGFEYEFLHALLKEGIRPAQIAVEFHHFLPHIGISRTLHTIWALHCAGYIIASKMQCDYLFILKEVLPIAKR